MVMVPQVSQASLDIDPRREGREHEQREADEHERSLALFHTALPVLRGGAFGEAGDFLR